MKKQGMNKKLIAIAVAGALGVPVLAYAQASTVQMYGQVRLEYSYVDEGANRIKYDRLRNPGSSYIGFRGAERLGGGNEAWFQIETNFPGDGAGQSNAGTWADRNTAVGLKGGFGNFFVGQWDGAYKRAAVNARYYGPLITVGVTGVGSIMHNETTTASNVSNRTSFYRRQANAINYHSPVWSGFQAMLSYSATDEASGVASGTIAGKPRVWELGANYINGPLALGAAYAQHLDYNPAARPTGTGVGQYNGGTDTGWVLAAGYQFAGVFRLSGAYERLKYETAVNESTDRNAWTLVGEWRIQGPHTLALGYVKGNSSGGNGLRNVNTIAANGGAGNTGATKWSLAYYYNFSKRTRGSVGYSRLNNDSAARYRLHGTTSNTGQDMTAWGAILQHSF